MTPMPMSSGDLIGDRRAAYADMLADQGDHAAAAEVLAAALALAPAWPAGWFRLGEIRQAAGDAAGAAAAYDAAVAADPQDVLGAGLKRDLLRSRPVAESMPRAFVEQLFDAYAERFDAALVNGLGYRGPQVLVERLRASGLAHAGRALDLGCGTGLSGEALRPMCARLEGVDISAGMLRRAEEKGVYDALRHADIQTLPLAEPPYDLIAAADVFIYLGALETVIAWCAGSLRPGGRLAFTVEAGETAPLRLLESRRFAHSRAYVEGLLDAAGFTGVSVTPVDLRLDRGAPVCAYAVCAIAHGALLDLEGDGEAEALA